MNDLCRLENNISTLRDRVSYLFGEVNKYGDSTVYGRYQMSSLIQVKKELSMYEVVHNSMLYGFKNI